MVVITATKLNKRNCNSCVIRKIFAEYTLLHSCNAPVDLHRREANSGTLDHNGAGGVTVAVKDSWCSSGYVKLIPSDEKLLSSHRVYVDLHPLHSDPPLICGTYVPFDRAHETRSTLTSRRNASLPICGACWRLECCPLHNLQEAADLIDKSSRMALDNMHEKFVKQTDLHPIDPVKDCQGECRRRTFRFIGQMLMGAESIMC